MKNIILASKSPRRQELLRNICDKFEIVPSDVKEIIPQGTKLNEVALVLAKQKALDVSQKYYDDIVIGCDTVVVIDDVILGKPKDTEHAYSMLKMLSGRKHQVYTGCFICYRDKQLGFCEKTEVEFFELSDDEIYEYIDTFDPFDKAGAYGIQTQGKLLVKGIYGDYYNVVGLPVARLKRELVQFMVQI